MQGARPRKLILHIGAHKTGTTAVQEYLFAKAAALEDLGWYLPQINGKPLNWGHMFRVLRGPRRPGETMFPVNPLVFGNLLNLIDQTRLDVVFSAEDLFFLNAEGITDFAPALRERFQEITVLAYLRRQDKMALSQWLQGGRTVQSAMVFGGTKPPFDNIGEEAFSYLDYATKIETWAAALPGARMILRPYERELFPNRNVMEDFMAVTGLTLPPEKEILEANGALGASTVRLVYILRAAGIGQKFIAAGHRRGVIPDSRDRIQPSRDQARAFLDRFADSNRRLAAMMGVDQAFDEDLSAYPEEEVFPDLDPLMVQQVLLDLYVDAARSLDPQEVAPSLLPAAMAAH